MYTVLICVYLKSCYFCTSKSLPLLWDLVLPGFIMTCGIYLAIRHDRECGYLNNHTPGSLQSKRCSGAPHSPWELWLQHDKHFLPLLYCFYKKSLLGSKTGSFFLSFLLKEDGWQFTTLIVFSAESHRLYVFCHCHTKHAAARPTNSSSL